MIGVKIDSLLRNVLIVDTFLVIFLNLTLSVIWSFNTFAEIFPKLTFLEKGKCKILLIFDNLVENFANITVSSKTFFLDNFTNFSNLGKISIFSY